MELDAGDMVIMHPNLPHCSGLNRGGAVRYAAYFRLLTPQLRPQAGSTTRRAPGERGWERNAG